MAESCEAFVRRRLGAVPPVSCFHVHEGGCSWEVRIEGDEGSDEVRVSIVNEARPLPLIGAGGALLGILNERGNFRIEVEARQRTQPELIDSSSAGGDPSGWVGAWME